MNQRNSPIHPERNSIYAQSAQFSKNLVSYTKGIRIDRPGVWNTATSRHKAAICHVQILDIVSTTIGIEDRLSWIPAKAAATRYQVDWWLAADAPARAIGTHSLEHLVTLFREISSNFQVMRMTADLDPRDRSIPFVS